MNSDKKIKLIVRASSLQLGLLLALFYLVVVLLIPVCVPAGKSAFTSTRLYPYLVSVGATVLAAAFAVRFRGEQYEIDLSIWPMVLGSVVYYVGILVVGFHVATTLVVAYLCLCWGIRSVKLILLMALVTPGVLYVFFTLLLRIRFPGGLIFG